MRADMPGLCEKTLVEHKYSYCSAALNIYNGVSVELEAMVQND